MAPAPCPAGSGNKGCSHQGTDPCGRARRHRPQLFLLLDRCANWGDINKGPPGLRWLCQTCTLTGSPHSLYRLPLGPLEPPAALGPSLTLGSFSDPRTRTAMPRVARQVGPCSPPCTQGRKAFKELKPRSDVFPPNRAPAETRPHGKAGSPSPQNTPRPGRLEAPVCLDVSALREGS